MDLSLLYAVMVCIERSLDQTVKILMGLPRLARFSLRPTTGAFNWLHARRLSAVLHRREQDSVTYNTVAWMSHVSRKLGIEHTMHLLFEPSITDSWLASDDHMCQKSIERERNR